MSGTMDVAASVQLGLPYGDGEVRFSLPRANLAGVIEARGGGACEPSDLDGDASREAPAGRPAAGDAHSVAAGPTPAEEEAEIRRALAEPIGAPRLGELAAQASSAVVVVSDVTRPVPSYKFLPVLIEELRPLPPEAITILFALGSHRRQTPAEQLALVGEEVAASGVRLLDFDREDCVTCGTTSRGTPLAVSRTYAEADLRICTGGIDYHAFAGFSGGSKSVLPGVCASASIQANHGMLLEDMAHAGVLEGNPVREDMDEAGASIGIDYLLNVLIDDERRIIGAVAGEFLAAHRAGCALHDARCDLRIDARADVVVASPGGAPKDIDLYQAQKTLDNVSDAVRDGGVVVLAARCDDGLGHPVFERWMAEMEEPADLVERIRREFVVGGHKAAAIAGLLMRVSLFLVSDLPDDVVADMRMTPFATVDHAVTAALQRCGYGARVLVVPHGVRVTVRG